MKILNKVTISLVLVSSLTFASNNLNFSQEELRELGKSCKNANTTFLTGYGTMYHYGLGQEKDIIKAIRLYQKSCDCNEYEACNNLGTIYEGEDGIKKIIRKQESYTKKLAMVTMH
jgi:cysteine-rich protein D